MGKNLPGGYLIHRQCWGQDPSCPCWPRWWSPCQSWWGKLRGRQVARGAPLLSASEAIWAERWMERAKWRRVSVSVTASTANARRWRASETVSTEAMRRSGRGTIWILHKSTQAISENASNVRLREKGEIYGRKSCGKVATGNLPGWARNAIFAPAIVIFLLFGWMKERTVDRKYDIRRAQYWVHLLVVSHDFLSHCCADYKSRAL